MLAREPKSSLHALMPWDNHDLPLRLTAQRAQNLKKVIRLILSLDCGTASKAYNLATLADGFYYILKKHEMPGLLVSGPFASHGTRVVRLKHYKVASKY